MSNTLVEFGEVCDIFFAKPGRGKIQSNFFVDNVYENKSEITTVVRKNSRMKWVI